MNNNEVKTCCLCHKQFLGWGNNPWPLADSGECCKRCNEESVIPARLFELMMAEKNRRKDK